MAIDWRSGHYEGSVRLSVAEGGSDERLWMIGWRVRQTFEVEEDVVLIVLEHVRHQLNIHVLDVDFLYSSRLMDVSNPHKGD